jgi:hypothetical protein
VGIGGSIFLIAVGAIIAFAVDVSVGWLDLQVVGWVLMLAGVIGLILTLTIWNRRRTVTSVSSVDRPVATSRTDTTYDVPEDPRY